MENEVTELRAWLTKLVTRSREEYEKLSEPEKKYIPNSDDYRAPCQMEVFWAKEPEFQFLVVTHFPKRNDLEIIINGPYEAYELLGNIERIMEEPRWREKPPPEYPLRFSGEVTYADLFAVVVANKINYVKNSIFSKTEKPSRSYGMIIGSGGWVWTFNGNMNGLDCEQTVKNIVDEIKKRTKEFKEKPKEVEPAPPKLKGFGAYFYPPIWIGKIPKPTLQDKLYSRYSPPWPEKAFDYSFGSHKLVFNNDGFLAISCENRETAIKILNTIMGASFLMGVPAYAVREQEVASAEIDQNSLTIGSHDIPLTTLRTYLGDSTFSPRYSPYERKSVSKEKLLKILSKSEKILKCPEEAELLRFLLEAITYLVNSEYSQAFTMSWIILEKHIFSLWESFLKQQEIDKKRRDKLTNPAIWSVDYILENLNLSGILGKEEYVVLNDLKNKRNNFIHRGNMIGIEDAKKCVDLSANIVKAILSKSL